MTIPIRSSERDSTRGFEPVFRRDHPLLNQGGQFEPPAYLVDDRFFFQFFQHLMALQYSRRRNSMVLQAGVRTQEKGMVWFY